jgi:hypothetical protein
MVVSPAFEELTVLLQGLESSDAVVRAVTVTDEAERGVDGLTAELTVAIPVLPGVSLQDGVGLDAHGFDVEDGRVEIDIELTLPGDGADIADTIAQARESTQPSQTDSSVPAYRDPEALQAVYEEYDTFPEMTDALGADVTSETVRRYMVEYDIHDPSDSASSYGDSRPSSGADSGPGTLSTNGQADAPTAVDAQVADRGGSSPDAPAVSSPDSADSAADAAQPPSPAPGDDRGEESLADLIAAADADLNADVGGGRSIPDDLTLGEFTAVINNSNTIHEVKQHLEMSQSNARQLLRDLDLIDIVTNRLAANQINVSNREVLRRMNADAD